MKLVANIVEICESHILTIINVKSLLGYFQLAHDITYLIIHPLRNRLDWSMIVCFTLFLSGICLTLKKLGKEYNKKGMQYPTFLKKIILPTI